ncbi:YjbH domain-containing protein [Phocaeicola sp.]
MKKYLLVVVLSFSTLVGYAQFTSGVTGLLHMPNAEMQRDGTFILGGNYLNQRNVPFIRNSWYKYNTYNYFMNITFFERVEIAYICTLNKGIPNSSYWPEQTWGKYTNQDRHFAARLQVVKEGEWWQYMPSVVVGVSDPTTGEGSTDYSNMAVDGDGNGYFNRWYIALTKHINTQAGEFGIHAAYLYNKRTDYPLNGPAFGLNFRPAFHKELNVIAEYDAKTINIGATYSLWSDHFNLLFELQQCKYISAGLVYKVNLLGGNTWKKWRR